MAALVVYKLLYFARYHQLTTAFVPQYSTWDVIMETWQSYGFLGDSNALLLGTNNFQANCMARNIPSHIWNIHLVEWTTCILPGEHKYEILVVERIYLNLTLNFILSSSWNWKYECFPLYLYLLWSCRWEACCVIFCQFVNVDPRKSGVLFQWLLFSYGMYHW